MNPLTFLIQIDNPAICPICQVELLGQVIHVYGDVVFCNRCINNTQYFVLNRVLQRCRHPDFAELFSAQSGLLVLNPKRWVSRELLQKLYNFKNRDSINNYPQFLGVVPEGYFKPSIDPPKTDKDPRHPDYRPENIDPSPELIDHGFTTRLKM